MLILIYGLLLYCITGLDLRQVEDVQALCLDGSLGSYYYSKGSGKGKNKFIIHFEGGDWILGNTEDEFLQNAAKRQQSMYGSSINRVTTQTFNGLLSENAEVNPNFYNWNLIHINYCDGTGQQQIYSIGFQGMKLAPIVYKSKNIYFRGELIVKSVFSKFKELFQEADTILLSGCSVGAIASLLWTDYLQIIIPTDVQIYCIPDSGILVDMSSIDGKQLLQTSLKIINYLVDFESTIPHEKCALNFPNQAWKCFYISNLLQYVTAPIFIIQSLYDSRFLQTYLQINCVSDLTLSSCTNDELIHINLAHDNFYNTINSIISKQPGTGSFAPSCLSNCLFLSSAVQSDKWAIPEKSGQTIQDTLMLWIDHQQKNTTCDKIALIDQVFWPDNSPCAYQLSEGLNNCFMNMMGVRVIIIFYLKYQDLIQIIFNTYYQLMALLTLRMLLSMITLNSLLQIYENQLPIDTSFNSSQQPDQVLIYLLITIRVNNQLIAPMFLTIPSILTFYLLPVIFCLNIRISHVFGKLDISCSRLNFIANFDFNKQRLFSLYRCCIWIISYNLEFQVYFICILSYYFPKSLNLIQICCSMLNVFHQIFQLACKIQDKINESNITLSQQQQFNKEVQTKSQVHPISKQGRRSKMSKKQNQNTDQLKQDKQLCEDQNKIINKEENQFSPEIIAIEEKQEVHGNEKGEPPNGIDSKQKVANIEPEKPTVEQETENENEPIHANLSEITSVKDEQKIQLQITLKGLTKCEDCNLDHFEKTTTGILEKNYTEHQIIQIQIHLLLNLYEANEDKNFKLWCLKKVLQLVY